MSGPDAKTVNEGIREARQRLGLSENDVAARAGLSWNEYVDLEAYDHEAVDVVHVRNMKKVAEVLHLDMLCPLLPAASTSESTATTLKLLPGSTSATGPRASIGLKGVGQPSCSEGNRISLTRRA